MHQPLNIPLTAPMTTRRDSRRVVALVSGIVFGACAGLFAFRVPFAISTTVTMAPTEAATIRVLKTDNSIDILTARFGTQALFPGAPWTLHTLFKVSRHEITIALLPNGEMVYIIDTALPDAMRQSAAAFGIQTVVSGNATAIGPKGVIFSHSRNRVVPTALLPWHDGEVRDGSRRGAATITTKGLTLHRMGVSVETARPTIPEESTVSAYLTTVAGGLQVPSALRQLMTSPAGSVLSLLSESGGTLLLTKDRFGEGYVLTTSTQNLTSEELAAIGKDVMNRSSLSTQALTIEDGSTYEEIVGANNDVTVEIRAEEDFTYVSLKNTDGDVIRMTKTPDSLTIANREIAVSQGKKAESLCLHRAHTWLRTDAFPQNLTSSASNNALQNLLYGFDEMAINNSKIRLCW